MKNVRTNVIVFVVAWVVVGAVLFYSYDRRAEQNLQQVLSEQPPFESVNKSVGSGSQKETVVLVPAVDAEGNGVLGKFIVEATPGNGKTLTNIDHILFFVDTQFSIQTAKSVAANITGANMLDYNIIYDIDTSDDAKVIEGPSAGAALTIATIAELENKEISNDVMITGTINPDGTIGKVGGIASKAKAARLAGAKVFLVPKGQGLSQTYSVETRCKQVGRLKVCETEYVPQQTLKSDESGLIVREVSNIDEALKYFLQ